jgi:hypothetical protein
LDYKIYGFSPEKIFNALMRRFGKWPKKNLIF